VGLGDIQVPHGCCPKDKSQRPVNLQAQRLRKQTRSGVIGKKPISLKLTRKRNGLGFPIVQ
jgi:hypothetical protein